jgi:hypothetical protein
MTHPREKCNVNFTTQYAFTDGVTIHAEEYTKQKRDTITCAKGHELVFCQGEKVKKYFRHKNTEDVGGHPMTEWHSRMQSYFPITEQLFKKASAEQTKDRRADVVIRDHNCVVEIQHSEIDDANVICRNKDYGLHDFSVIWLIDGNTKDVLLEQLSTGNFLINFNEPWKYKSFQHTYEFVLLDIANKIFKIPIKKVCNKMILVKEWKPIDDIMRVLNEDPNQIWLQWEDDNEIKASLTVHQKGAGNGKTYGIWKSIVTNIDKELFIIVTKQHSAKVVIRKELDDQAERNEYHIDENMNGVNICEKQRKYIVKYNHNHSHRKCTVIIATIDSFVYNLTHTNHFASDYFSAVLKTISHNGCTNVDASTGSMRYAGEQIKLNKKAEVWIDETQDLHIDYFHAIVKMMWETKADVVVVGDKLQSLEHRNNFMTCVEEDIPNITTFRSQPVNHNRRIRVPNMADQINSLIRFNTYCLPQISFADDYSFKEKISDPVFETIETPCIYASDTSLEAIQDITKFVDNLICTVDREATVHHYIPEDFLFIFPIMKYNRIACELETKLNHYWIDKIGDKSAYTNYAILHKHEEGKIIDMTSSEHASRIVTIRTSKGDGRKVVFVLGCTERSLKVVSRCNDIDLIYESYLHVALTRAKEKIYFGLEKNNDDLHRRFGENGMFEYKPIIQHKMKLQDILDNINKDKVIALLQLNGLKEDCPEQNGIGPSDAVDWQYHCIRRAIYLNYAMFIIMSNNQDNDTFKKSQLFTIINKINKLETETLSPKKFYQYLNAKTGNAKTRIIDLEFLPICNLSQKSSYKGILSKLHDVIDDNKRSYKEYGYKSLGNHSTIEAIVQHYLMDLFINKKFHEISPTTIYNIVHCLTQETDDKTANLLNESEQIKSVSETVMNEIIQNNDDVEWNIEHMVFFGGKNEQFSIYKPKYPILGFSNNTVFHLMFITDLSNMNYWDTMVNVLLERFLLHNPKDKGKDIEKFKNKHIKTYLFVLKQNTYKLFDWNWEQSIDTELKNLIKYAIVQHFSIANTQLFCYLNFIKKNAKKWSNEFKSPYLFIAHEFDNVAYIRDSFVSLDTRYKFEKEVVLEITNNPDQFCKFLEDAISTICDSMLGLNQEKNTSQDDDEW